MMIEYLETLKRAHDHPKQRRIRFTTEQKIEILWKLAKQWKSAQWLNDKLGLPTNSVFFFSKQLRNGELGIGHTDLIEALAIRIHKIRAREHLTQEA